MKIFSIELSSRFGSIAILEQGVVTAEKSWEENFKNRQQLFDAMSELETDWPSVQARLEAIRSLVFSRSAAIAGITLDAENWTGFQPGLNDFLASLPNGQATRSAWQRDRYPDNEAFTIPAQVNYVAKGANLYEHGYRSHGSALVINKYLYTTYLWEKIRVQGGAYNGMATWDRLSGVHTFVSYRDPNLGGTLDNFDGAAGFLKNLEIDSDELTKTIIGTIGDVDGYQLPDAKGYSSLLRHLTGVSEENRQQLRDEILGTRPEDFSAFGAALEAVVQHGKVVVLGAAEKIRAVDAQHGGDWLSIQKAL